MDWLRELIKSILAGITIGIGCIVYLSCDNKYVGAILFSIGLISILLFKFNLYTGKVCFIPFYKTDYTLKVLLIFIGNIIGCSVIGVLFPITPADVCLNKLSYDPQVILAKAIMCGLLIYIAVESYNKTQNIQISELKVFILSSFF
jgi:formate/nitrite transporter FocA (FNT family)